MNASDQVCESEIAQELPRAADAVLDLARIVLSQAEALNRVAKRVKKHDSGAEDIQSEIEGVIGGLKEAVDPARKGPSANGGEMRPPAPRAWCKIFRRYRLILRVDEKLKGHADRLRRIQRDRERLEADEVIADAARASALDANLVGLAFSGGGIRSATFNLGILQGLASFQLLGTFDYLSTVSGGGYIGAWLSAWIHREKDIDNVQKQLCPMRIDHVAAMRGWLDLEGRKERPRAEELRERPRVEERKEWPRAEELKERPRVEPKELTHAGPKEPAHAEGPRERPRSERLRERPRAEELKERPRAEELKERPRADQLKKDGASFQGRMTLLGGVVEEEPEPIYHLRRSAIISPRRSASSRWTRGRCWRPMAGTSCSISSSSCRPPWPSSWPRGWPSCCSGSRSRDGCA